MPPTPEPLDRLANLTRRYSAWGRGGQEGGLPLAWGGLTLMLLVCGWTLMGVFTDGVLTRQGVGPTAFRAQDLQTYQRAYAFLHQIRSIVLILPPLAWILGKDALRDRVYQSHGRVEPPLPLLASPAQWISRGLLVLAGIGFPIAMAWRAQAEAPRGLMAPQDLILALTAAWALPWLGWHRVRGTAEALLWTTMGLLTLLWLWWPLTDSWLGVTLFLPSFLVGPVVFAFGLVQHLRFRKLDRELQAMVAP